jgi:hypothetical protein
MASSGSSLGRIRDLAGGTQEHPSKGVFRVFLFPGQLSKFEPGADAPPPVAKGRAEAGTDRACPAADEVIER